MIKITTWIFFINHPLSMGLLILTQTLTICLISGILINSYWFSYILFLTFLGGLLVLFIYVSRISSNEIFQFPTQSYILFFFIIILLISITILLFNNIFWINFSFNSDIKSFYELFIFFNNENQINLTKLYNIKTYILIIILIIYLFIRLIAIVKITNIFFGPLRTIY